MPNPCATATDSRVFHRWVGKANKHHRGGYTADVLFACSQIQLLTTSRLEYRLSHYPPQAFSRRSSFTCFRNILNAAHTGVSCETRNKPPPICSCLDHRFDLPCTVPTITKNLIHPARAFDNSGFLCLTGITIINSNDTDKPGLSHPGLDRHLNPPLAKERPLLTALGTLGSLHAHPAHKTARTTRRLHHLMRTKQIRHLLNIFLVCRVVDRPGALLPTRGIVWSISTVGGPYRTALYLTPVGV